MTRLRCVGTINGQPNSRTGMCNWQGTDAACSHSTVIVDGEAKRVQQPICPRCAADVAPIYQEFSK